MPDPEMEARIVLANLPDAPERLVQRAVAAAQRVRQLEVEHKPAPSETVQWVSDVMGMFGGSAEGSSSQLEAALPAVCKNAEDETQFQRALQGSDSDSRSRFVREGAWNARR
jgi:hypothetical protein